jgi:hypothetical protein
VKEWQTTFMQNKMNEMGKVPRCHLGAAKLYPNCDATTHNSELNDNTLHRARTQAMGRHKSIVATHKHCHHPLIFAAFVINIIDRSAANEPPPQSTYGTGGHELRRWQGFINGAAVNSGVMRLRVWD